MGEPLRVLLVEDSEDDAWLVVRLLQRGGYDLTYDRVETAPAMEAALQQRMWDVIIADYTLPHFNGLAALRVLQEQGLDLPFIVVSGTIGEELAVAAMKAGARDYLLKGNLTRLLPAIARELREAEGRRALTQADAQVQRQREALFQHEKLALMGQLLAGVAHELNNPLSVILGQAALLQQSIQNTQQRAQAGMVVQAAERCARIVNNFLALARQRLPARQPVHVNQVVREAVELVAYPLRVDSVDVHFELAPDLPVVWGDRHQLHQMMVNLVANAHQAMREGADPRHLTLATGLDAEGRQVWLEVRDTGPGVAAALQKDIFEPFVTTKPPGMGTGLGLSLCREIVEAHGGTIRLGQADPQGAVFRVTLPVEAPRGAALEETPPAEVPAIRGKRVLVVDDEPAIAGVVAEVLGLDGHVVETVAHGGVALAKVRAQPYDLILSDLRMPELDGSSFYRELARLAPQLLPRVIFMTGDTLSASTRAFLEETRVRCLGKPFTLAEIRAVVQRALQALEEAPARE